MIFRFEPGTGLKKTTLLLLLIISSSLGGCLPSDAQKFTPFVPDPPPLPREQITFSFTPYQGVPGDISDQLLKKIRDKAKDHNIQIALRYGEKPTYVIRGRLSTASNQSSGVIFYQHALFDENQNLVYDMVGQESLPGTLTDPWSLPPSATLDRIADHTLSLLDAWLS